MVYSGRPLGRREIDEVLVPKLPDRLTDQQKRIRVRNLLQELRRGGLIENCGSRGDPSWRMGQRVMASLNGAFLEPSRWLG